MTITGGPVFWILLLMALVTVVTYFERLLDLRRAQIDYQDFLKGVVNILDHGNDDEALSICDDTPAPVATVVATAIRHARGNVSSLRDAVDAQGRAEIGRLDRRLAVLAIIAQAAPLMGLLGTVIGFIKVLRAVDAVQVVARVDLINGMMEALVVTGVGLGVMVIASVMYGSLRVRLDRTIVELEAAASQIVGYLSNRNVEAAK